MIARIAAAASIWPRWPRSAWISGRSGAVEPMIASVERQDQQGVLRGAPGAEEAGEGIVAVGIATAVWVAFEMTGRSRPRRLGTIGMLAAPAVLAILVGIGGGFAAYQFGIGIWTPDWAYSDDGGAGVSGAPTSGRPVLPSLQRVFDETQNSGFGAQAGGRLASYAAAMNATAAAPLLGHGLGQQADVAWAWGGFRARTPGSQPGVDNAFLTVGLKAGAVGIAAFAAMVLWPLRQLMATNLRRMRPWFVPAWLTILGLMLLQSFAVSGYAPAILAALIALPGLGGARRISRAG